MAIGLTIVNWDPGDTRPIISGALSIDTLALFLSLLFYVTGLATVALSLRAAAVRETGAGRVHEPAAGLDRRHGRSWPAPRT
ncbi:MAG: hypothetical protein WKF40_07695 [Thermoleophilaceae bacterium]